MNGSVANGTIRTIPKPVGKTNECFNKENSSPFALSHTTPVGDGSMQFSPQQNNLEVQQIPDEVPILNNFHGNVDSNLEHVKSSISQNATVSMACDAKLAALQNKNYNFAPLHVECDSVGNFLLLMYLEYHFYTVYTFLSCTFFSLIISHIFVYVINIKSM